MAELMRVDAAGLRHCGPAFAFMSTAIDETLRRLGHRLDAEGACWGSDEMGTTFGASYGPAATDVREALPSLRDGLTAVGESLLTVADNADAAEGRSRHRFS